MNNWLSLPRLFQVMKRDVQENWKEYMHQIMAVCAVIVLFFLFMLLNTGIWGNGQASFNRAASLMFRMAFMVLMFVKVSQVFRFFDDKGKRISYLMLPATTLEKYLSRVLIVIVGWAVVLFVLLLGFDVVRVLIQAVFSIRPEVGGMCFWDIVYRFTFADSPSGMFNLISVVFWIWVHSLYLLGGCFWYKRSTLYVTLIIMAVSFFSSVSLVNLAGLLHPSLSYEGDLYTLGFIITGILGCFTLLNYYWGYRLFKSATLRDRKLFRL